MFLMTLDSPHSLDRPRGGFYATPSLAVRVLGKDTALPDVESDSIATPLLVQLCAIRSKEGACF